MDLYRSAKAHIFDINGLDPFSWVAFALESVITATTSEKPDSGMATKMNSISSNFLIFCLSMKSGQECERVTYY